MHFLPSPRLSLHLDSLASSPSSSKSDPLPSPYLFGEPLRRVRTRTSSLSSSTTSPPSDLLASPLSSDSPYALGCPLSRIRTRTDSTSSLPLPLPLPAPKEKPLYSDSFVALSRTHLTVSHLLLRRAVSFPLSRIRSARSLLSPSQRIQLVSSASSSLHLPADFAFGLATSGLGWTGIAWARDPARVKEGKALEGLVVVLEVEGWIGRVGFSVEDEEGWWDAWRAVKGG
ncbi:hypothetical protein JCM8097_007462 [Rhodosporidiobolus ruineniae]